MNINKKRWEITESMDKYNEKKWEITESMVEYDEKKVQKQKYTWDFRLLNEKSNEQWMNITESFLMQGLVVSQRRFSKN